MHYIALSQDYANIDEVFARLQDLDFLERMTERAYEDIVASGRYSYRSFVEGGRGYRATVAVRAARAFMRRRYWLQIGTALPM